MYVIVIYPTGYNLYIIYIYMIFNDYLHVICCTLQTPILTKIPPNRSLQQTHLTHIRKTPVPPSFSILCATSLPASTAVGQRHILAPKNVDHQKTSWNRNLKRAHTHGMVHGMVHVNIKPWTVEVQQTPLRCSW